MKKKWDTLDDGALLAIAQDQFDVLLTIDRGLEFQQNIAKFRIGVLVIHVLKNQIAQYESVREELLFAVERVRHGELHHVGRPLFTEPNNRTTE